MSQQQSEFQILLTLFAHDRAALTRLQEAHNLTTLQEALSFALGRLVQLEEEKEFLQETVASLIHTLEQERMELASTQQELTETLREMQSLNTKLSHLIISSKTQGQANADAGLTTQAFKRIQAYQLQGLHLRRSVYERYRRCLRRMKSSQQASATLLKKSAELLRPQPPTDKSDRERKKTE